MKIYRRYKRVKPNEMPKKLNIFKRWLCKHELVDDISICEGGFRTNGQDHIVYCTKCGHIVGGYVSYY